MKASAVVLDDHGDALQVFHISQGGSGIMITVNEDNERCSGIFGTADQVDAIIAHLTALRVEVFGAPNPASPEQQRDNAREYAEEKILKLDRLTWAAEKVYGLRTEAPAGNRFVEFCNSLIQLGHVLKMNAGHLPEESGQQDKCVACGHTEAEHVKGVDACLMYLKPLFVKEPK